ncbi:hypothetical protein [Lactococcus protaetiae]|uniref:Uncharacterized protein n=1 Tax=Lactococcus protaetiae TaxID=2592653 RepID=A0A514ZA77_9LACT|nr:hypothetical protein [Lactococcus protaetiae]QDK71488.1 hypothetical protein FLP15_10340 [Lactococcus protaetiae]
MVDYKKIDSDYWFNDEKLADKLGVKKETIQIKIRKFEKIAPHFVINAGKRITFIPAFIAWDSYQKKYRGVAKKPKFEYVD